MKNAIFFFPHLHWFYTGVTALWWVKLGWILGVHQAALSLFLLNSIGEENMKEALRGRGKDSEITYQLQSWAKHTWL